MFLYGIYRQIILKEVLGNNPMCDGALLGMFVFTLLISLLFLLMKLKTNIDKQGIYVLIYITFTVQAF